MRRASAVNLNVATQSFTVATLSGIPAGQYLIVGHADAVNFGPTNTIARCSITAGAVFPRNSVAVAANHVVGEITTTAAVSSATAFDATLSCSSDTATTARVEDAYLYAIRTDALDSRPTIP